MMSSLIGSTTGRFEIGPVQFVALALAIELVAVSGRKTSRPDYRLAEAILHLTADLAFGDHLIESIGHFHRLLRHELAEIDSWSLHQLIASVNQILVFAFKGTVDGIYHFANTLSNLTETYFHPESPLGIFIRRARLSIYKLEFDQVVKLSKDLKAFCTDHPHYLFKRTPSSAANDSIEIDDGFKLAQQVDPIKAAYLEFTDTYAPDFNRNANALRRFYDTRANPGMMSNPTFVLSSSSPHPSPKFNLSDLYNFGNTFSGSIHSKALLSLAHFHYQNEAFPAAYDALEESTRLARMTSDRNILDRNTCLRRRLDHKTQLLPPPTTLIAGPSQSQITLESHRNIAHSVLSHERLFWDADEELFSVSRALDSAEPLHKVYGRLFRAKRMTLPVATTCIPEEHRSMDKLSWFGLQAKLWYLKGQPGLCKLYHDLALSQGDKVQRDEERPGVMDMTLAICDEAIRIANRGDFVGALVVLMEEALLDRSSIKSFEKLHHTVFEVLTLKAYREKDRETLSKMGMYRTTLVLDEDDATACVRKQVQELYAKAQTLMQAGHVSLSLCPILRGTTLSKKMSLLTDEAIGVTKWAEAMIWCEPAQYEASLERLERMYDCPGLRDRPKERAEAILVRARCEICRLKKIVKEEKEVGFTTLQRLVGILDLLKMAEICYKKIRDFKMGKVCVGYRRAIINEGLYLGYKVEELGGDDGDGDIDDDDDEGIEKKDFITMRRKDQGSQSKIEDNDDDGILLERVINALNTLSARRYLGVGS